MEKTSGGVRCSFPLQNGHSPSAGAESVREKSLGLFALSVEIITHLPSIGSFLNCGILLKIQILKIKMQNDISTKSEYFPMFQAYGLEHWNLGFEICLEFRI
jgi:hypothetical protein